MNIERLEKMAAFLDKLPQEKFDFAELMRVAGKHPLEALAAGDRFCGTVGCAMGWMPAIFPGEVEWTPNWSLRILNQYQLYSVDVEDFLEIESHEADWLFFPGTEPDRLDAEATPHEVAAHIRRFIAAGGIPA